MSLQGKTLFIWQIKVAKTTKAKLCATTQALCHNQKQTIQEFGTSRILKFCAFAKKNAVSLTNQGCKGCQNEALCHNPKLCATTKSKLSKNSAHSRITLCVFAGKNAVYLANQSCKGCQNEALCHNPKLCATKHGIGGPGVLWHIKIRYLPNAVSQSLRIQLALNSLIRTPVSLAEKHSKAKTGPFCLTTLQKVEFPCFFKSSKTQALCHNQKQTIQEFGTAGFVLLCLCREKCCLFGKSKLQRRQKQSSVPRKINFHQIPGSLSPIFHIFKNKKLKGLIFGVNL